MPAGFLIIQGGKKTQIEVRPTDIVLAMIGSMVADSSVCSNTTFPDAISNAERAMLSRRQRI
jgi:hypothetical protein